MRTPLFPFVADAAFERFITVLNRLGAEPPQVLLLEGGREEERLAMARYWAARCNCMNPDAYGAPCLRCPVCLQIASGEYLDVLSFDGRISNREDEENPGPVRAFTVEHARDLKRRLSEAPHGEGRRVVVLMGLTQSRDKAANALLKALEEPTPRTVFVLLAPQREHLLPTLISRSFCLTLPWVDGHCGDEDMAEWEESLAGFLRNGQDFLERVAAKNAVNAATAGRVLLVCQKACINAMTGGIARAHIGLGATFADFTARDLAVCCRWFVEAQEALNYNVAPARVLQALAARLYVLRNGKTA
jgi:DNA polymerase-3 subunit delta'